MFALRSLTRAVPQTNQIARNMSVMSGPPKVRISFAEKVAHGVVMTVAMMAIPTWVLVHIREYRGQE